MKINNMRKKRLLEIAKIRIAYHEYEAIKEGIENNIAAAFSRIGKSGAIKTPKKNKKAKDRIASALVVDPGSGGPAGIPGLGIFAMDGTVEVPDDIKEMIHSLEMWKEHVGQAFEQKQKERPGLVWGLPETSIYEGLDKDIEAAELEGERKERQFAAQVLAPQSPTLGAVVSDLNAIIAPGGHLTNGDVMTLT
jgi:transcriptional adapter 3